MTRAIEIGDDVTHPITLVTGYVTKVANECGLLTEDQIFQANDIVAGDFASMIDHGSKITHLQADIAARLFVDLLRKGELTFLAQMQIATFINSYRTSP